MLSETLIKVGVCDNVNGFHHELSVLIRDVEQRMLHNITHTTITSQSVTLYVLIYEHLEADLHTPLHSCSFDRLTPTERNI